LSLLITSDIERDEQALPLSPSKQQQLQETISSIGNNPKQVTSELDLTAPAAYKRILIVDDDPDITFTFKLGLKLETSLHLDFQCR
jgi:hypothetical protein